MPPEIHTKIDSSVAGTNLSVEDQSDIIKALNNILKERDFYREQDYSSTRLPEEVQKILPRLLRDRNHLSTGDIQEHNHLLIEAAYPREIAKRQKKEEKSGYAVSSLYEEPWRSFVEALRSEGLIKMGQRR